MTPPTGDDCRNPGGAGDSLGMAADEHLECILEAFDDAWNSQIGRTPASPPVIEEFLQQLDDAALRREGLVELVKIDLEYQWRHAPSPGKIESLLLDGPPRAGRPTPKSPAVLEDYVRQFPELGPADRLSADLVAEEYRVRRRWGDRPEHESYQQRFPHLGAVLELLLSKIDADSVDDTSSSHETNIFAADFARPRALSPLESARLAGSTEPTPPPNPVPAAPGPMPQKIGRYTVRSLLGRGSFGTVYLGFDEDLNRQVAIKVPRPGRMRNAADVEAFLREARLAAQLRHPALVEVFDVGREADNHCYIVMQYVEGHPLNELLGKERLPLGQIVEWLATVAEAVHCAHKMGLVHCDLKPANILIDRDERPHVADFGLVISEEDQRSKAGQVSGSPAYMAPEQVRGESHRLDGRTDIWSLGVILYEMLVARRPFAGQSAGDVFDEILHREPKPPRQIDDAVPAELEWICLKCLSKDVRQRYTTCMDLVYDLRQSLQTRGGDSQRHSFAARGRLDSRRPPGVSFAGVPAGEAGGLSQSGPHFGSLVSLTGGPTNLPPAATSFVGRGRESAELLELLKNPEVKLVTLIGPGGMGKTRLSQQVAQELMEHLPGGCWFADLTDARTAAEISRAVAKALGVPLTGNDSPEQAVGHVLEYRKPLLLILDNFEQAVEHAEATVGVWRRLAPHIHFLVTSRASLGLAGEREYELGPLSAPPRRHDDLPASELHGFDSVQLFCQRAREALPSFVADAGNLAPIATICAELEGIPLAVELAAARVKLLRPADIARKLGQKFQLLQSSRRDLSPRQQTLSAAIEWSYDLLNEWEKQAFMQACLFRGGFYLDAAEAVIDLSAVAGAPLALDAVQSLRDKSLLTRHDTKYETRFGMYQSVREYGEQKWLASSSPAAQQALQRRFAEHYVAWAEDWKGKISTDQAAEALDRLQLEIENLFAVEDFALAYGDAAMAARAILAVANTLALRGPMDQRVPRLERAAAALNVGQVSNPSVNPERNEADRLKTYPTSPSIELLVALCEACQTAGDWNRAVELADRAVELGRRGNEPKTLALALRQQGEMRRKRGELDAALECFAESESLAGASGDRQGVACNLSSRGFLIWQRGQSQAALACYTEAENIVRALGDHLDSISIARHRGQVLAQQGDNFGALRSFAEAEATARQLGDQHSMRLALGDRATVLATQGDFVGAIECYTRAESLARRLGDKRGIAINVGNRGILLADQGEPQAALACYEQAEAINRAIQSKFGIAVNVGNRANALADLGRDDEALACYAEAEQIDRQMGNKFLLALTLGDRAALLLRQGNASEAQDSLQQALSLLSEVNSRQTLESFAIEALLAKVQQQLGQHDAARQSAAAAMDLAHHLDVTDAHPKLKIREHFAALRDLAKA